MADVPTEKSLDDFFAKRDKKKKKEKGKGKETAAGPTSAAVKKNKKEKEKSAKSENQDAQIEKVMLLLSGNFFYVCDVFTRLRRLSSFVHPSQFVSFLYYSSSLIAL